MITVARRFPWVLALALVVGTRDAAAGLPAKCCGDPMPAPLRRPYRKEPEEELISQLVLLRYFKDNPLLPQQPVCVTLPGHKPPTRAVRKALREAGVLGDRRANCRFEEDRVLWAATGVWQTEPGVFKAHVIKSEFGHVSLFLEGYEYTVRKVDGALAIVAVQGSACNPGANERP